MVRLAWRMLRERPISMIATFLALWFAVVIVTACGEMLESGVRYHGPVQRYAAAPVLVATTGVQVSTGSGEDRDVEGEPLPERGHLPASLIGAIAAAPGVRAAIADVAVPSEATAAGGASAVVEVHPWSAAALAPFTLRSGHAPDDSGAVVLDRALAVRLHTQPGQRVRLALPSGLQTFTVDGIAATTGATPEVATVFVTDAEAAALTGDPGTVETIGVLPDPGISTKRLAAAVTAALPAQPEHLSGAYPRVFSGHDRGSAESPAVDNGREFTIAVSSVFGGMTLLIAILVIAGTVGLSVTQRQRDIALLRAIAATPRQVRRMVVREAAALGVLAAAGIWPGLAGAAWLRDQLVSRGLVPATFQTHLSWLPPLVAASAALLIAVVAAWIASLRASRIRPTEALAETAVERGGLGIVRVLIGLVALAGGVTLCAVSASVTGDSAAGVSVATVFTLVVAVALLSPLLIRATAATLGRMLAVFGATGRLAVANAGTSARKLATVVSSLVLAIALGGSLWFVQTSEIHVAAAQSRAGVLANYVVTPAVTPGLSSDVTTAIRGTNGVAAATGVVHSTLFAPHDDLSDFSAEGVDTADLAMTLDLDVTSGSIADLRGDTVALDNLSAGELHLGVGGTFTGWFGDGTPAHLRVVAIYRRGLGFAQLTLPHDVLIGHTAAARDDAIFVTAADRPDVAATLRGELARIAPGSSMIAGSAYQAGLDADLTQNAWTNQIITGVLLVYVVIAAVNALVMAALARRREFAVLRLAGTTRLQVRRMVRLEQTLLLGLALVLGIGIATATLLPMVKGITGSATPYIPLSGWVAVLGGTMVLGSAATVIPVRRVLRMRPVDAIGLRE
ncbi:MAG TPA: FtsX-like permease family protein [Micromonosporaceae bacterium]